MSQSGNGPTFIKKVLYPAFFLAPFVSVASETITPDKWFHPLSEPVRSAPRLATASQQYLAFVKAEPFPESVTEDRWHQPFSEPQRFRLGLRTVDQQTLAFHPNPVVPFIDGYLQPLSEPRRGLKPGDNAHWQQTLAFHPNPIVSIEWWRALAEPVRFRQSILPAAQQTTAFHTEPIVSIEWWRPLEEPVRFRQGLPATEQWFHTYHPSPVISIAWHVALSEPQRFPLALQEFNQQYVAFQPKSFGLVQAPPFPPSIDMRSGFKTPPHELVREWTGLMVRVDNLDMRHPQEFVRPTRDNQNVPDPRPEADDTFLTANEVTRDDF